MRHAPQHAREVAPLDGQLGCRQDLIQCHTHHLGGGNLRPVVRLAVPHRNIALPHGPLHQRLHRGQTPHPQMCVRRLFTMRRTMFWCSFTDRRRASNGWTRACHEGGELAVVAPTHMQRHARQAHPPSPPGSAVKHPECVRILLQEPEPAMLSRSAQNLANVRCNVARPERRGPPLIFFPKRSVFPGHVFTRSMHNDPRCGLYASTDSIQTIRSTSAAAASSSLRRMCPPEEDDDAIFAYMSLGVCKKKKHT